jgi:hypothetical protein
MRSKRTFSALRIGACLSAAAFPVLVWSAEGTAPESGQITLRKSVGEREYKGKAVEGEERQVAPGDSLWRILIKEKGLSDRRFSEYVVVIRGLNPGLSANGALRIGDTIFIPLRPDEVLQFQSASLKDTRVPLPQPGKGTTQEYRIRQGDHLYQVLRERLGIGDERQLATYYALVKDLNPQKKNWDLLVEGETIRLPVLSSTAEVRPEAKRSVAENQSGRERGPIRAGEDTKPEAAVKAPVSRTAQLKPPEQRAARENVALVGQVLATLGNEVENNGEEAVMVKEGTVRLERNSFPLVLNRKLDQRVILDLDEKIPPSIREKLAAQKDGASVFSFSQNLTVKDAVSQLLSRLGYQPLSVDRPLAIQEGGLALEAKGEWTVLAPQESNKRQEIFVINLGGKADDIPDYLQSKLASSGVHFKEVPLVSTPPAGVVANREPKQTLARATTWPRDKREIVDSLLFAYGIPFGVSEVLPVEVRQGIKVDTSCDRLFEVRGKRTALFFRRLESEVKRAMEEKLAVKVVELDLGTLSSRELIGRLLGEVGEPVTYKEHRFNAANGAKQDKLVISAWGFLVSKPAMFVTDRQIPKGYERFFFDQGLDIVYFQ